LSFLGNDDPHWQKKTDSLTMEGRQDTRLVGDISIVYAGWQLVAVSVLGRVRSAVLVFFLSESES
jgi:hypothetical protein